MTIFELLRISPYAEGQGHHVGDVLETVGSNEVHTTLRKAANKKLGGEAIYVARRLPNGRQDHMIYAFLPEDLRPFDPDARVKPSEWDL